MLIQKTFCSGNGIPLRYSEFRKKKIALLLTKYFFSSSFRSCKFFHERVSCVKNAT